MPRRDDVRPWRARSGVPALIYIKLPRVDSIGTESAADAPEFMELEFNCRCSERRRRLANEIGCSNGSRMTHAWYVTFEVPRSGTLVRRRSPRSTKTFETEAEAKEFARGRYEDGLIVSAGTINPHLPRRAIPSSSIPDWLESGQKPDSAEQAGAPEPTTKRD
jgi:hypothetical protein